MAIRPKTQVGIIGCLCCGHDVPVKAGENGTLNLACPWCDFPAYAKAGTEAHRIISGKMRTLPGIEDEKEPAMPPPKQPAGAREKSTIFG